MGFAILRVQKLKAAAGVRRSMAHTFREQDTPNADPSRTPSNTHDGPASVAEGLAAFNAALPDKVRKNAVLCIEYLVTASPEALAAKDRAGQDRYFADALDWLKSRHGSDNVVCAVVHRDETSPHLVAYVVPRDPDTGRLNCRKWLGGADALRQMQTDFAQRVGQQHGLRRGIEHSRAQHTTIREFYGALNQPEHKPGRVSAEHIKPKVLEKGVFSKVVETPEQVAERITSAFQRHYAPAVDEAATARLARRKADEATRTADAKGRELETAQKRLQGLERAFGGLGKDDMNELVALAAQKRQAAALEVEKQRRVDRLAELAKKAAGAVLTFAEHALAAIKAKAGQWRQVEWSQVERSAMGEALRNGQSRAAAATAILDHSPGKVGIDAKTREEVLTRAKADDAAHGLKPEPDRSRPRGPSMGR